MSAYAVSVLICGMGGILGTSFRASRRRVPQGRRVQALLWAALAPLAVAGAALARPSPEPRCAGEGFDSSLSTSAGAACVGAAVFLRHAGVSDDDDRPHAAADAGAAAARHRHQ